LKDSFYETWKEKIVTRASSVVLESWTEKGHSIELRRRTKYHIDVREVAVITSDQVWEVLHRIVDKIREFASRISIEIKFGGRAFIPSFEDVVASGLEKLGYELVESMTTTPSGSSVDFVVQHEGRLIGVEVKNRKTGLDDLKEIIDARSKLGFESMMLVSYRPFDDNIYEFAKSNGINLETIDSILKKIIDKNLSTNKLERNISNLIYFIDKQPKPKEDLLKNFGITLEKSLRANTNEEKKSFFGRTWNNTDKNDRRIGWY